MLRKLIIATAVAGTLDLLAAFFFAGQAGWSPTRVLQFVASGPFGDGAMADTKFAPLGVLVHYGIMACMVATYLAIAPRFAALMRHPIAAGLAYGTVLWLIMYFIVRPTRWPQIGIPHDPKAIAGQLFCHLILVGIPIAWIAARGVTARGALAHPSAA